MKKQKFETLTHPSGREIKQEYQRFLTGKEIYLRDVKASDVNEEYYQWLNDPEVNQYVETRFYPQTLKMIEEYVQKYAADQKNFVFLAIVEKTSDRHIGNLKMGPINWYHRFSDIAVIIGKKDCWGKGYGTDAICAGVKYAFQTLNLHRLNAYIYDGNIASQKAFIKAGFRQEGVFLKKRFLNGVYVDEKIYGIVNEQTGNA